MQSVTENPEHAGKFTATETILHPSLLNPQGVPPYIEHQTSSLLDADGKLNST
jgi:hypothetical protein